VPVLLLDSYNLLFRSFASLPQAITAHDERPINAVYGMLSFIARAVRENEPSHVIAAFDSPETPTFRNHLYSGYQAQRGPLGGEHADEFARQVEIAFEILPKVGIPTMRAPGFEADDIMGTLAVQIEEAGGEAIAVSTDRDLLQLITRGVSILIPSKENKRIETWDDVCERIGVGPEFVTTFKALAGDSSDNIPGLPGIGAKTAIGMVERFGNLDAIYEHLDELPARQAGILDAGRETAYLFQRVATIQTDVPGISAESLPELKITGDSKPRPILDEHYQP
jgi:DNA polymerase-1